jgi:hypothetical protein
MAERFLAEKTTGIQVAEVRVSAKQSLHLTGAAIPVSRGTTVMQAAPGR